MRAEGSAISDCLVNDIRGGSGAGSLGGAQQLTGGGVVAEIFRDLQKPSRFSGGGG